MNIRQALYENLTEVTVTDSYYGRIMVKGIQKTYVPVDFRLKKRKINIPLSDQDIYFQYKMKTESSNVCRGEYILTRYYPIGTTISIENMKLQIIGYGEPTTVAGATRVPIYTNCLNQEESNIIEVITNKSVEDKVKRELEGILISNDIIKRSLPYYKHDWLNYTEENISGYDQYLSLKKLFDIKFMESKEYEYRLNDMNTILDAVDNVEFKEDYAKFLERMNYEKMPIRYNSTTVLFNLISIAKWILFNREFKKGRLFLQNSYNDLCELDIRRGNNNSIIVNISTPEYSLYDYRIELKNVVRCSMFGVYYEYVMDNIRLFTITKGCCGTESELINLTGEGIQTSTSIKYMKPASVLCNYSPWGCINNCPPANCNATKPGGCVNQCNHNSDPSVIAPPSTDDPIILDASKFSDTFFRVFCDLLRYICASPIIVKKSGAKCKNEYYDLLNINIVNLINNYKEEIDEDDLYSSTAEEFKARYVDVLSLTTESVIEDDRDRINEAIDDYDHLSEDEKTKLVDERLHLTELIEALDNALVKDQYANGLILDNEGLSLTYNGVKIGDPIAINVISEKIVEDTISTESETSSGLVTTIEF